MLWNTVCYGTANNESINPFLFDFFPVSGLFTHIFAFPTVSAEASQTAIDHLDAAEHHLQHAHGEQYGEQNHVPQHNFLGEHTGRPQRLVYKVAAIAPVCKEEQQKSKSNARDTGHKFEVQPEKLCQ